jgi:hypothetical protein
MALGLLMFLLLPYLTIEKALRGQQLHSIQYPFKNEVH